MPYINPSAAARIRTERERLGYSPEALSVAIAKRAAEQGWDNRGCVNPHTLRRIEKTGHVPSVRVRFVLASFFDTVPHLIWVDTERVWANRETPLDGSDRSVVFG